MVLSSERLLEGRCDDEHQAAAVRVSDMLLKPNLRDAALGKVRQRKMPRQVGAGTAANMRCRIDCIAVSAVQGIRDVHGATATAASASSGAVSAE